MYHGNIKFSFNSKIWIKDVCNIVWVKYCKLYYAVHFAYVHAQTLTGARTLCVDRHTVKCRGNSKRPWRSRVN